MGFAAGVVFASRSGVSHPELWSFLIGLGGFSGTLQFVIGDWLRDDTPLYLVALLTLAISFRYSFYGFALLNRWKDLPLLLKMYLIGGLADENFALESACRFRGKREFVRYCLCLTMLDMSYWSIGAFAGALAGVTLPIPNRGIEFVMAALFLTILTDQCKELFARRRTK